MIHSLAAVESTVIDFPRQPQSLVCPPAMPSHLGPKSPRVTNVNHKIDGMHKCLSGGLLSFLNSLNPQMDFTIWITRSLREGWESWQGSKTCMCISRFSSLQRWRLGGIYSPLGKTSHFIAIAILDTSGMTYTAPMVTELQ